METKNKITIDLFYRSEQGRIIYDIDSIQDEIDIEIRKLEEHNEKVYQSLPLN